MADAFRSGTAGDVYVTGQLIAGISQWSLDQQSAPIPIPNFQSTVDGNGRVWPDVLVGLSGATGSLTGYFNVDPTDYTDGPLTSITTGIYVNLVLVESKLEPWGYAVYALLSNFNNQVNVNNQANTFTANFTVSGEVPISAVVTP